MKIYTIGDLHLYFGTPSKTMELFGEAWKDHPKRVKEAWEKMIGSEDLVLIPGDISWGMRLDDALIDLEWIDALPGTKVMIRGNHDYWWGSLSKLKALNLKSIHFIHNTAVNINGIAIAGSRLWDTKEYSCEKCFPPRVASTPHLIAEEEEQIYNRELLRLEESLKQMDPKSSFKIAMTHYPPLGSDLAPSRASNLLEKYGVKVCLFGHLHGTRADIPLFGEARGINYILTSCDHLGCKPLHLPNESSFGT